jgi:hypothetical protein
MINILSRTPTNVEEQNKENAQSKTFSINKQGTLTELLNPSNYSLLT